mgnify:FL=1
MLLLWTQIIWNISKPYAAILKVLRLSESNIITDRDVHDEMLAKMLALVNSCSYKRSSGANCSAANVAIQQQAKVSIPCEQQTEHVAYQTEHSKQVIGKRYATMAEEDDNEYFFRRVKDRVEDGDTNRYFVLTIFDDGTGTFEMTDDIVGEKLQTLLDNKNSLMASGVVKTFGTISSTCSIVTRTVGEVEKSGKSWHIVKPLMIEFK